MTHRHEHRHILPSSHAYMVVDWPLLQHITAYICSIIKATPFTASLQHTAHTQRHQTAGRAVHLCFTATLSFGSLATSYVLQFISWHRPCGAASVSAWPAPAAAVPSPRHCVHCMCALHCLRVV